MDLIKKYKAVILYLVFGVLTTIVNIVVYTGLFALGLENLIANAIAWLAAVLLAFFTNKSWVFGSTSFKADTLIPEFIKFMGARVATLVIDMAIMYVGVDVIHGDPLLWKFIANVVVVVSNWLLSKFFIFKTK